MIAPIFTLSSSHRLSTSLLAKNLSKLGLNSPASHPKRSSLIQQTEPKPTQTTADYSSVALTTSGQLQKSDSNADKEECAINQQMMNNSANKASLSNSFTNHN